MSWIDQSCSFRFVPRGGGLARPPPRGRPKIPSGLNNPGAGRGSTLLSGLVRPSVMPDSPFPSMSKRPRPTKLHQERLEGKIHARYEHFGRSAAGRASTSGSGRLSCTPYAGAVSDLAQSTPRLPRNCGICTGVHVSTNCGHMCTAYTASQTAHLPVLHPIWRLMACRQRYFDRKAKSGPFPNLTPTSS